LILLLNALKLHFNKVIKFSKPEKKFPQKTKVEGGISPLNHLRGTYPPSRGNPAGTGKMVHYKS
jgi:hypothetical protein